MVVEQLGRKISLNYFYEALRELESRRIIVTHKNGKERYINTIYNILGIKIDTGQFEERGLSR